MPEAVFLDLGSTSRNDLDLTRLHAACGGLQTWEQTSPQQCREHIGSARIVISNKVVLDAELLQSLAPQLELICIAATGTNNVDLQAAKALGIPVANVRDYASQSVAEHVMALIFALRRQLPAYQTAIAAGAWQHSPHFCLLDFPMTEIACSKLAIIGHGVLGQKVASLAVCLGMEILIAERPGTQPRPQRVSFEYALQEADVISLHCPLTPATRHLFNAERLRQMKPSALLINTARGGMVDENALLTALGEGWIAGAGIDVLAEEPPGENSSPLLQVSLSNLIVTPHVAWASRKARQSLIDQLADIVVSWKRGGQLNRVA